MLFRLTPRALALSLALAAPACAGAERSPRSLPAGRAIHEAIEELPGVVLTGRHFSLSGQLEVVVAAPDSAGAAAALARAFAVADSVDRLVSPHFAGSEVARINAAAGREPIRVSPWTEILMATALEWAARTGGAFDPTVGPVIEAWGFSGDQPAVPTNEKLEAAQRLVDWRKVRHDRAAHTVFLADSGMVLDLRAMAKGFALDRMRERMTAAGATGGVLDFDGDVVFFGPGTESKEDLWPIEIPNPYDPTRSFARFELPGGSISTSSYYDRMIEIEGEQYGHVVDPRTGWPVRGLASVSVYAQNAFINDILSTALFVMGPEEGRRFAENLDDVETLFVEEAAPGQATRVHMSAALNRYVKRLDPPVHPVLRDDE